MRPVPFKEANCVLHRPASMTEEECSDLHVFRDGQVCVSLWRPSWRERLSALLFGRVWLYVAGGVTQPPVAIEAKRSVFTRDPDLAL